MLYQSSKVVQVCDTPQVVNWFKVDSDAALLPSSNQIIKKIFIVSSQKINKYKNTIINSLKVETKQRNQQKQAYGMLVPLTVTRNETDIFI